MFSQMFDLKPGVVSVIGSGGKTTLLSTLARELPGPVILCTTTHMFPFSEYPLISGDDAGALNAALARSRVVCLGQPGKDGKLTAPALSFSLLRELASWVLVEADGSKRLPLKAHASYEPVIPPESSHTILVAGASGPYLKGSPPPGALLYPHRSTAPGPGHPRAGRPCHRPGRSGTPGLFEPGGIPVVLGTGRAVCPRFAGDRNPGVCREPSSKESFSPS